MPACPSSSSSRPRSASAYYLLVAAAALSASLPAFAAAPTSLHGNIEIDGARVGAKEMAQVQVYFEPSSRMPLEATEEPFEVVTFRKEFQPRVLAVPVGSTVRFPNRDAILHNVFSVSGQNRFDLGLYRRGPGETATFDTPGVVRVFCNVHHSMVAYVVVVDSPFVATPEPDGRFVLDGLPAGRGRLTVWYERAEPWVREIELPLTTALDVHLEVTKPRVPPHRNKFGKRYSRRRGRVY